MSAAAYSIRTWDDELQEFTPQIGCPSLVHGLPGLRHALRTLQSLGYAGRRPDHCTLVERVDTPGGGFA